MCRRGEKQIRERIRSVLPRALRLKAATHGAERTRRAPPLAIGVGMEELRRRCARNWRSWGEALQPGITQAARTSSTRSAASPGDLSGAPDKMRAVSAPH